MPTGVHSVDVKYEKNEVIIKGAIDEKTIHAKLEKWSKKKVEILAKDKIKIVEVKEKETKKVRFPYRTHNNLIKMALAMTTSATPVVKPNQGYYCKIYTHIYTYTIVCAHLSSFKYMNIHNEIF